MKKKMHCRNYWHAACFYRGMNIFTSSSPAFNPDQFMVDRPAPSAPRNDNTDRPSFAEHVNNAERSASRNDDRRETYNSKDERQVSKPEHKKSESLNNEQTERRPEADQKTEDTKYSQQASDNDNRKKETGPEVKEIDEKTVTSQDTEGTKSDLADNDVKGDKVEDSDIQDNESGTENIQVTEQTITTFDQTILQEISIANQVEQVDGSSINSEEANLSDVKTDTETFKPDVSNSNKGEAPLIKGDPQIIDENTVNIAAADKKQVNTANDRGLINNESKETVMDSALDEITSGEPNSGDDQTEESGADNKAPNKNAGFGKSDIEELPEDFDLNADLKEKIRMASARELPDRYAKKTVIDQSDNKINQSQINVADPEVLEGLNNFKTLQDGMLFGNTQNSGYNSGINNAFKGLSDTSINSLESMNTNTAISNAELAQNQGMAMSGGKAGASLLNGNAARTAGFSELLNQVVYTAKGKSKLNVTVNHEEFGKLKINVTMEKGLVNIHVNASDKVVREYLESNVQSIIESLSKDGVSVGGFSVALKDHKDNPEKKFLMDSGLNRQYENIPVAAVHSNRGLVNVFA